MLPSTIKYLCAPSLRSELAFMQSTRAYSARSRPCGGDSNDAADLDAARQWYSKFDTSTIPRKIAATNYARGSGNGGQKMQKTSSKATTRWPVTALVSYVPKFLHAQLPKSRYYAPKSDSIVISCDSSRMQSENTAETHARLFEEIRQIYKQIVPGVTSPEQQEKTRKLQKAENAARLKMKKEHGDKKRARSGGGRFDN